jgi:predicted RNase H-like HicB family nuclease
MRYAIVIERTNGNYSAYVPDLPGCVTTGATIEEIEQNIREAVAFHLDHDDLGSIRSEVVYVIDSKSSERDAGGKPVSTFPHPALDGIREDGLPIPASSTIVEYLDQPA